MDFCSSFGTEPPSGAFAPCVAPSVAALVCHFPRLIIIKTENLTNVYITNTEQTKLKSFCPQKKKLQGFLRLLTGFVNKLD